PYYGGPEEGGWWGEDIILEQYQYCQSSALALDLLIRIEQEIKEKNRASKQQYGDYLLQQTEWLDARGLEDSYLREPDGEEQYIVLLEAYPGEHSSIGCRHYE